MLKFLVSKDGLAVRGYSDRLELLILSGTPEQLNAAAAAAGQPRGD